MSKTLISRHTNCNSITLLNLILIQSILVVGPVHAQSTPPVVVIRNGDIYSVVDSQNGFVERRLTRFDGLSDLVSNGKALAAIYWDGYVGNIVTVRLPHGPVTKLPVGKNYTQVLCWLGRKPVLLAARGKDTTGTDDGLWLIQCKTPVTSRLFAKPVGTDFSVNNEITISP